MSRYIVFVALVLAVWRIRQRGLQSAFLDVWLPIFLLIPVAFRVDIPGLPDPNFMQAAILPILYGVMRQRAIQWRLGPMEVLVILYALMRVWADFLSRGYSDAQNYAFYMLASIIGPYLLGRWLIDSRRMDIDTARRFVIFVLLFPLFLYEAKFWVNPIYKLLAPLFPSVGSGLSIRMGIARTAGPFEHPILACVMIIAAYRLHRWLCWMGQWRPPQPGWVGRWAQWTRGLPVKLETQISCVLVVMAVMTLSRGPWLGGLAGAAVAAAGQAKNRRAALAAVLLALLIAVCLGQLALQAYITPADGQILSGEAQTMLYRKSMVDQYQAFLFDKPWAGWGLTTVPKIRGMESVDNAFFLMALQHGVPVAVLFAALLGLAIVSQLRFGLQAPMGHPPIGFSFAGIYVMCLVSFATVYMGAQTEPLVFLLLGWGESIKRRTAESWASVAEPAAASFRFRRVLT